MGFWSNFWGFVKKKIDQYDEEKKLVVRVQDWEDVREYNPLAIANTKLTSLVCDEATVELQTDSTLVQPLIPLADNLQAKLYEICSTMCGKGGVFVTMATGEDDEPYHRIIAPADVSVYRMVANKMYEVAMVIDKKIVKHREYRLIRHHILDENGTLYVYYYTTDKSGNEEYLAEWEHYKNDNVMYMNAFNIGVAYFCSPQDSRGLSQWGVPLNFGCEEAEEQIRTARKDLNEEMKLMKAKLFADKSITMAEKTKEGERYDLPEGIYTIQKRAGVDGTLIDSFAPGTRYADYKQKLIDAKADWEDMVGLDRGFLTEVDPTNNATATQIKNSNVKTRSMVKKIQSAMFDGIKATLEADAVFLNIPLDLYTVMVDWFDAFQDETELYNRVVSAVDRGVLEKEDELRWLFPNMTDEEIADKLARIEATIQENTDLAIENILNGR
ncbi:MAG: hypothetical protein J6Q61_06710 [Bacteroidales bacterium]|nr:hypothetical protein [Bacteroidales bacterium]